MVEFKIKKVFEVEMSELTTILLTCFVVFGPQQGKQEAALATYKASGLERTLTDYTNTYPQGLKFVVVQSVLISSVVTNRYVQYGWEF